VIPVFGMKVDVTKIVTKKRHEHDLKVGKPYTKAKHMYFTLDSNETVKML